MLNFSSRIFNDPIPATQMPGEYRVVNSSDEPLINLEEQYPDIFLFDLRYVKSGLPGAISDCLVRTSVAELLYRSAHLLPDGYQLKVFDAWRPRLVQLAIYDQFYQRICNQPENAGLSEDELRKRTACFVSFPSEDLHDPFVHSTGGSVDLTIVDPHGNDLDMGTKFDDFSAAAYTNYFEGVENTIVRDNRRLLYHTMLSAGFTNLPSEWWHYDYGNKFWGFYKQEPVIYEGIIN